MPLTFFTNRAKRHQYVMMFGDVLIVAAVLGMTQVGRALIVGQTLGGALHRVLSPWLLVVAVVHVVALFMFNLYELTPKVQKGRTFVAVAFAVTAATALSALLLFFVSTDPAVGRVVLVVQIPLIIIAVHLWHLARQRAVHRQRRDMRLAIAGNDNALDRLVTELRAQPAWGYDVVAVIIEEGAESAHEVGLPVIRCTPDNLAAVVEHERLDGLVYSVREDLSPPFIASLLHLRLGGLHVIDLPSFFAQITGRIPVFSVTTPWVLQALANERGRVAMRNSQRAVEVLLALFITILASPVMLLIALAVRLDSRGPALFSQVRLGLNEKAFTAYKFRTMVTDAEVAGPKWAEAEDPRITRTGRILRATGLDELPQIFNVLRGEMAFVGFRPIRRHFADQLAEQIPYYRLRFHIRPGVTGWPQVRPDYAYFGTMDGQVEKFEYELFYLKYGSPLLDAYIIMKTAQKLLRGRVSRVNPADAIAAAAAAAAADESHPPAARRATA